MARKDEDAERPWVETVRPPDTAGMYECLWHGRPTLMFYGRSGCWILSGEPRQPSFWREMKRRPS